MQNSEQDGQTHLAVLPVSRAAMLDTFSKCAATDRHQRGPGTNPLRVSGQGERGRERERRRVKSDRGASSESNCQPQEWTTRRGRKEEVNCFSTTRTKGVRSDKLPCWICCFFSDCPCLCSVIYHSVCMWWNTDIAINRIISTFITDSISIVTHWILK